jgi:hypothetical protein
MKVAHHLGAKQVDAMVLARLPNSGLDQNDIDLRQLRWAIGS